MSTRPPSWLTVDAPPLTVGPTANGRPPDHTDTLEPGDREPGDGLSLVSLTDLLSEPDLDDVWVWENRLRVGGVALLAGKPKAGKSTFARALAVAVARGDAYCGGLTRRGLVWYLALEEHPDDVRRRFRTLVPDAGIDLRFYFGPIERGLLSRLHAEATHQRPVLIIVDTLQRLAQMSDTNDYAQTTNAMNPLLALARNSGAALVLLHHVRKGEAADPQDGIMGSLGITASTDCNLVLSRTDTNRTLWSRQRIGPDLAETVLLFDEDTGAITLGDRKVEAARLDLAQRIVAALTGVIPPGLTESELFEEAEGKTAELRRALREMVGNLIVRTGGGQKGDPYRYSRSLVPP